jgi:hypothetical protein
MQEKRRVFERNSNGVFHDVIPEIQKPTHDVKVKVLSTVKESTSLSLLSVIFKCNLLPLNSIPAASNSAVVHVEYKRCILH